MLKKHVVSLLLVPLVGVAGALAAAAAAAALSEEECAPDGYNPARDVCIEVVVTDPGDPSDPDDGDGDEDPSPGAVTCRTKQYGAREPYVVPCYDAYYGYWSNADSCYWSEAHPQPASSDPVWEGHYPEGAIYAPYCLPRINMGQNNCFVVGGTNEECREWRATPPWEVPDPGELARQALQRMRLSGPDIGMAPPPGSKAVIGMPVWLWNRVSNHTWTTTSAPACDAGLCVTVTATAEQITWRMGDGHQEICDEGTPYSAKATPTCSHTYRRASNGKYQITATTSWHVTWQANNALSGELAPFDLTSNAELQVVELGSVITK